MLKRAKALHVDPIAWNDLSLEEAIGALQAEVFIATMADGLPSVTNLTFDHEGKLSIPISLKTTAPLPLTDVLELLAEAAWLVVRYRPTGIILSEVPTEEHVDEDAAAVAEPAHIPGLPPPASTSPPSSGLLPWMLAPQSAVEASVALVGWGDLAGVITKYLFIGEPSNLAGERLLELYEVFRDTGTDLEALVRFVTVYPTRADRLACDQDS